MRPRIALERNCVVVLANTLGSHADQKRTRSSGQSGTSSQLELPQRYQIFSFFILWEKSVCIIVSYSPIEVLFLYRYYILAMKQHSFITYLHIKCFLPFLKRKQKIDILEIALVFRKIIIIWYNLVTYLCPNIVVLLKQHLKKINYYICNKWLHKY